MDDQEILHAVLPYTVCSSERVQNVLMLVESCITNEIPGDFVEIGVFRGGILMAMALKCKQMGATRKIYGYDTYSGMTAPTKEDTDRGGVPAEIFMTKESELYDETIFCTCSLEDVKAAVEPTGYPFVEYCVGDIRQTDLTKIPSPIALLRLDTDWYESTAFELRHFEPHVSKDGFVIIDDYGHWNGSRKAVDEFFETNTYRKVRIDYSGLFWQKD